jgi:hypothetical protein
MSSAANRLRQSEPLLTADEAARHLRVPRSSLYELVRSRGLPQRHHSQTTRPEIA